MLEFWAVTGAIAAKAHRTLRSGSLDRAMAELAGRQHGLVRRDQLLALGFSSDMITHRVAAGRLHRVYRGVYSVGTTPRTRHARWLAAVYACGPGAVLSHRSAAALWGIRGTAAARIEITSPGRRGHRRRGLMVHSAAKLDPRDVTTLDGIPVTTLARTIIDLAGVQPASVEYAIHRAEARRKITPEEIRAALDRNPGLNGVPAVRAIVGPSEHDLDTKTRSPYERALLAICRAHDIALPDVNRWIPLEIPAGGLEVDFCWPGRRLVVEVDEDASHHTLRARRNDPERDLALNAAGWRVVRVKEEEFTRPAVIAGKLLRALGE